MAKHPFGRLMLILLVLAMGRAEAQETKPAPSPAPAPARGGAFFGKHATKPDDKLHTPKPGTKERRDVLDALRPVVRKDLKQPVIFEITIFNVQGNWAFVLGTPRQPNGKPINYKTTKYADDATEGAFSASVSALLKRQGKKWRVVTWNIGATDLVWEPWPEQYHAPRAIFALPPKGEKNKP